jgi:hypothetical protein
MRRNPRSSAASFVAALAALACLASATPSPALQQNPGVGTCVSGCMDDAKSCEAPVREAGLTCRAEAGCDLLKEDADVACEADRTSDECTGAIAAVKECAQPCREAQKAGLDACRTAALACLRDECGVEGLPPRCGRPARGA